MRIESILPVTLFTGQWADMPIAQLAQLASKWGYDGLEIAASGDHLNLKRADEDPEYIDSLKRLLGENNLELYSISNHLAGQAICDALIDSRHKAIVRDYVWGDGEAEGVRQRAAEDMKRAARVARKLGAGTVVGFTGSAIWHYLAMFPPVSQDVIDEGYKDFARRWNPILDEFESQDVKYAHEVHPGEIAYDYWTSMATLEAIEYRPEFGFNWDPSHMVWQGVDPVSFIWDFQDRIYHVDCKDTKMRAATGRGGILGSHLPWGDPRRPWDFVSTGRGDVEWEAAFRSLVDIGYKGPISVEWEDAGMDRLIGAPEALQYVKSLLWKRPEASFDAAFSNQ